MAYNLLLPSSHKHAPVKGWTVGVDVDQKALEQIRNVAALPFIHHHVAVMPDVHYGIGATVGTVIATKGAIVPAAVGVDIGCGMLAVKTDIKAERLTEAVLKRLRAAIEKAVPVGAESHDGDTIPEHIAKKWDWLAADYTKLVDMHGPAVSTKISPMRQLGTLGGGNHFIEVSLDLDGHTWVVLHSGSRGVGNRIGRYFIEKARKGMEDMFIHLPDKDLAYFSESQADFNGYVQAVGWAQEYALANRAAILYSVLDCLLVKFPGFKCVTEAINCHHNYVEQEHHFGANVWVTRKGAVRAREGDLGIIPGSMGTRSYIVRGKGEAQSFNSCSHGAGRVMSRGEAKGKITLEDHALATAGIECRKDADVLDESPAAYKPIEDVMAAQADLVDIVTELRQVLCVKG